MANIETKKSGVPYPVKLVAGIILIAIGAFLNTPSLTVGIIDLNPSITVTMIGVLLALFPVIESFYTEPLGKAINERNTELEHTFAEAENLRTQMAAMRSEYEARLQQTEAEARAQIEAQIKEAQQLRQTLMAEAAQRADELVERAQQEIDAEKNRVLTQLRTHVVDLSLAAAEKVISENMDTEKNRKLVEEFINQVEVAR